MATWLAAPIAIAALTLGTGDGVARRPRDALWGVDEQGIAWRSRDGRAWQRHSYIGPVQAPTAADHHTAYAASSRSLYTLG